LRQYPKSKRTGNNNKHQTK